MMSLAEQPPVPLRRRVQLALAATQLPHLDDRADQHHRDRQRYPRAVDSQLPDHDRADGAGDDKPGTDEPVFYLPLPG